MTAEERRHGTSDSGWCLTKRHRHLCKFAGCSCPCHKEEQR